MKDLIDLIASVEMPNVFNPWRHEDAVDLADHGPTARRFRLAQHFNCKPRFLLIGEAPGYQGCHFTGVPFTNEKLILDGKVPRVDCRVRFTARDKPWSEPSATVVWGALHENGIAAETVMWNAFAWHPYKSGDILSNRTPTRDELIAGSKVLRGVVDHFGGSQVVAVGKKAAELLAWLGVWSFRCVRHPSMGGANEFRRGLVEIVQPITPPAADGEA